MIITETQLRECVENDAAPFQEFLQKLYAETEFTYYEPGEKTFSVVEQAEIIKKIALKKNSLLVAAFQDETPFAYLYALGGESRRTEHSVTLAFGMLKAYWNKGYGKSLYQYAENWMKETGISRAELLVVTHNIRAIHFYLKLGFQIEGLKKRAIFINDRFVDMYLMSKMIT